MEPPIGQRFAQLLLRFRPIRGPRASATGRTPRRRLARLLLSFSPLVPAFAQYMSDDDSEPVGPFVTKGPRLADLPNVRMASSNFDWIDELEWVHALSIHSDASLVDGCAGVPGVSGCSPGVPCFDDLALIQPHYGLCRPRGRIAPPPLRCSPLRPFRDWHLPTPASSPISVFLTIFTLFIYW